MVSAGISGVLCLLTEGELSQYTTPLADVYAKAFGAANSHFIPVTHVDARRRLLQVCADAERRGQKILVHCSTVRACVCARCAHAHARGCVCAGQCAAASPSGELIRPRRPRTRAGRGVCVCACVCVCMWCVVCVCVCVVCVWCVCAGGGGRWLRWQGQERTAVVLALWLHHRYLLTPEEALHEVAAYGAGGCHRPTPPTTRCHATQCSSALTLPYPCLHPRRVRCPRGFTAVPVPCVPSACV
jgi:hypothetical protein